MPIPLPNLDDRQFADLAAEMQARIARFAPEWTNHNAADPGIMLLELFAWLTESTIYRINRVPESSRMRFLEVLGGFFSPAEPATVRVAICAPNISTAWTLPRGSILTTSRFSAEDALRFETLRDVTLTSSSTGDDVVTAHVIARQTDLVENEEIGVSNGEPFQLFTLSQSAVVLPANPFPIPPEVSVDGEPWTYVSNFSNSSADDHHFTVKTWVNGIAFGNGKQGRKPPRGAKIRASYRYAPTRAGAIVNEDLGESDGAPNQYFRLRQMLFAPDLRPRDDFEPTITIDNESWQYRADALDMGAGAAEFTVEPARNAVRFGNGPCNTLSDVDKKTSYGLIPEAGKKIFATYRYTVRTGRKARPGVRLMVADPGCVDAISHLTMTIDRIIAPGRNATDVDAAHERALHILKPRWRAISTADVESIIVRSDHDIARANCLPGRNINIPNQEHGQPGHISTVILPEARYQIDLPTYGLKRVLEFSPDGSHIVALDEGGHGRLINLRTPTMGYELGSVTKAEHVAFSPSGGSLVTAEDDENAAPVLRSTSTGQELAKLHPGSTFRFSENGAYLIDIAPTGQARLRNAEDGTLIADLSDGVTAAVFGAGGRLLATAHIPAGEDEEKPTVRIWDTAGGVLLTQFVASSPIEQMAFSRDGRLLATADEQGAVRVRWANSGKSRQAFALQPPVKYLDFSDDGKRLVGVGAGESRLWSARSSRPIVAETLGDAITDVRFSPDSQWLVAVQAGRELHLWDARRGEKISKEGYRLCGMEQGPCLQAVTFSPSSRRLLTLTKASTASDKQFVVSVWDLTALADDFHPSWERASTAAAIDDNGSWVCYADGNLLRLWDAEAMKQMSALYHERKCGDIDDVVALPSGRYLAVDSKKGKDKDAPRTVHIWNANHVFDVRALIEERRLITSQHHVDGPAYTDVYIAATIAPGLPLRAKDRLRQEIANIALYDFFHPLSGGPDGQGWPWGRDVYASEIYQILEGVEGVDHVESLTLSMTPAMGTPVEKGGPTFLRISPFHLVNYVVRPDQISFVGQAELRPQNIAYRTV